jgi:hypothetical protein
MGGVEALTNPKISYFEIQGQEDEFDQKASTLSEYQQRKINDMLKIPIKSFIIFASFRRSFLFSCHQ